MGKMEKKVELTLFNVWSKSSSSSGGIFCIKVAIEALRRGITEVKISIDNISEQNGSTHFQPNDCIKIVLIITNTDPNVSANTCKNTPKYILKM